MRRLAVGLLLGSVVALVLVASLAGCTTGDDDGSGVGDPSHDEVAAAVCGTLVAWVDEVAAGTDLLNAAARADADAEAEAEADEVYEAWAELMATLTDGLRVQVRALPVPEGAVGERLRADLEAGAEAARAEVDDVAAEVAAVPEGESLSGRFGVLLVGMEKAMAVVEPPVFDYGDADLAAAFAAEPDCEHVTEP